MTNPVHIRILLWCSLLGFAAALWTVLRLTSPLPGQELPIPRSEPQQLTEVTRLCVEEFEGGENARQLRAMLIDQLQQSKAFLITENPANAQAFLRGFAEDLVYTEQHQRDQSISGRSSTNISSGGYTRSRSSVGISGAVSESQRDRSAERKHEASLSVRIVNAHGDILWAGSAESRGGKYRSAVAEVSAKVVTQLKKALQQPNAVSAKTATDSGAPSGEDPTSPGKTATGSAN